MASTLEIINNFVLTSQGLTISGKQGDAADADTDPFEFPTSITIAGDIHYVKRTLATATVITLWDDDNDVPTDWDYFFFWADVDMYLQFVGSSTNFTIKILAKVSFVLTYDSLLAAADTTLITGGTEPTLQDIDSVACGNYSGGSGNLVAAFID